MTDKEKIRKEVERLRSLHQVKYQQLDADNSMSLVECGKRNLCNELLSFIDSLQKEPVKIKKGCKYLCLGDMFNNDTGKIGFIGGKIYLAPEDNTLVSEENGWRCDTSENASNFELVEEPVSIWHDASEKPEHDDLLIETNDGRIIHRQSINNYGMVKRWAYTSDLLNLDNSFNLKNNSQEEPVSEDLGDYINELSKQFPEVSFAKLSRIAVRISRWQQNQDVKNKLPKVINRTDLDEYAYQCAYDMSNDWAIENPTWKDVEDACKLGANWQKEQDQSTIELAEDHAMLAGMEKMKEEMMTKAIDAEEEALKAYPPISIAADYDTIRKRDAFEFGYLKAEKDLELSWEDIVEIDKLLIDLGMMFPDKSTPDYYKEVLKRFKEKRNERLV